MAEAAPWVGPQLAALRTISQSSDEMLGSSLLPLATAAGAGSVDALKPVEGRIDPSAVGQLNAPVSHAAQTARAAVDTLEQIETTSLLGAVRTGVEQVDQAFRQIADQLDALAGATQLLPGMLGQDGVRTYLVLVQNNAEARSLGGIAGSTVLLRAENGAVSLIESIPGNRLSSQITRPVAELTTDAEALYGTKPAQFFQNITQIPDFGVDGPLARQMYESVTGVTVDGVIAVDPVVLSSLLKATGPVRLQDGTEVNADNAVSLFLNDVYKRYPNPRDQDAFFSQAVGSVLTDLLSGKGSTSSMLAAFSRAAEERRILVWSAHDEERAVLSGSSFAGALPSTDHRTTRFGVYLNETGGSKMSFYSKPDVSLAWVRCAADGRTGDRELSLRLSLTSTAPADAATSLPTYLTANGAFGVTPGNTATRADIFLPEGWDLVSATTTSGTGFDDNVYAGRRVLSVGTNLAPGMSDQVEIVARAMSSAVEAEAWVTPTADASIDPTPTARCEDGPAPLLE